MNLEIKVNGLNDVSGTVWLATAMLTYEKCLNTDDKLIYEDLAFSQVEIRMLASKMCSKNVQPARVSQWCNADHPNNQYNYLKEVGALRRLTIPGEHHEHKEMPNKLIDYEQVLFTHPLTKFPFTYSDLVNWIRIDFRNLLQKYNVALNEKHTLVLQHADTELIGKTSVVLKSKADRVSPKLIAYKVEEIWLSEDEVKSHLEIQLIQQGWNVKIAWGKMRGIDIEAFHGDERWIIEVKGSGSRQPMRVNYFIGMLGELLQRMDDPHAKYSIAFPDMKQFRRLWNRLPKLAKERTGITALFVNETGRIEEVE